MITTRTRARSHGTTYVRLYNYTYIRVTAMVSRARPVALASVYKAPRLRVSIYGRTYTRVRMHVHHGCSWKSSRPRPHMAQDPQCLHAHARAQLLGKLQLQLQLLPLILVGGSADSCLQSRGRCSYSLYMCWMLEQTYACTYAYMCADHMCNCN